MIFGIQLVNDFVFWARDTTEMKENNAQASSDRPLKPVFLLTVDTEEEWDWNGNFPTPPFSTRNIDLIPEFQAFCKDLGVRPTYFVDYAVTEVESHVQLLKHYFENDECDIGAHLHPWCTPPIEELINNHNSHAVNLPDKLVKLKLETLTTQIETAFGQHPYSYRAGRWGVNGSHLHTLSQLGYRVDSSVRPFYSDTSFNYTAAPTSPYWPSLDQVINPDHLQRNILEVPATSGYNHTSFELMQKIHAKLSTYPLNHLRLVGILWRLGLIRKITVTPEGHEASDICQCIDASIARGDLIINMFFHSSDLLPGCTPYVRSAGDKERFMECLRHCIEHIRNVHNATFLTMRDIRQHMTGAA